MQDNTNPNLMKFSDNQISEAKTHLDNVIFADKLRQDSILWFSGQNNFYREHMPVQVSNTRASLYKENEDARPHFIPLVTSLIFFIGICIIYKTKSYPLVLATVGATAFALIVDTVAYGVRLDQAFVDYSLTAVLNTDDIKSYQAETEGRLEAERDGTKNEMQI